MTQNKKAAVLMIGSTIALLIIGAIAACDYLHVFSQKYGEGYILRYFQRTGLFALWGIGLGWLLKKYIRLFLEKEVLLFIGAMVLFALPYLIPLNNFRSYLFIGGLFSVYVNPWGILLSIPLLHSIHKKGTFGFKSITLRFFISWVILNLVLIAQPDVPMLFLFNVISLVIIARITLRKYLRVIIGTGVIVVFFLILGIAKPGYVKQRLELAKSRIENFESDE